MSSCPKVLKNNYHSFHEHKTNSDEKRTTSPHFIANSPHEFPHTRALFQNANSTPLEAKLQKKDGSVYSGEVKNNSPHGKGTLVYPNGNSYEGQWLDGKMHGEGKFYHLETLEPHERNSLNKEKLAYQFFFEHNKIINTKFNIKGHNSPISWALENKNTEIALALLPLSSSKILQATDKKGRTALHWAAKIESKAYPRDLDKIRKFTNELLPLLSKADVDKKHLQGKKATDYLKEHYATRKIISIFSKGINEKDESGNTALHKSSCFGAFYPSIIETLIPLVSDETISAKNNEGQTLLMNIIPYLSLINSDFYYKILPPLIMRMSIEDIFTINNQGVSALDLLVRNRMNMEIRDKINFISLILEKIERRS